MGKGTNKLSKNGWINEFGRLVFFFLSPPSPLSVFSSSPHDESVTQQWAPPQLTRNLRKPTYDDGNGVGDGVAPETETALPLQSSPTKGKKIF